MRGVDGLETFQEIESPLVKYYKRWIKLNYPSILLFKESNRHIMITDC